MKKEIESVIRMILGMVKDDIGPAEHFKEKNFFSEKTNWRFGVDHRGELEVLCWLNPNICGELAYSTRKNSKIDMWDVRKIHAGLGVFAEGMAKEYPRLTARWNKFLDAAEYFENR